MDWYIGVLKKYAVFEGRARRKEYWMFYLFNFIFTLVAMAIDGAMGFKDGNGPVRAIYSLAVFLPLVGVSIRRMHDTNHSGWWCIVPLVNLIFALTEGTTGSNRFGTDPKGLAPAAIPVRQAPVASNPSVWSQAADPVGYEATTTSVPSTGYQPSSPVAPSTPVPPVQPSVPANWYADPTGRHQYRYWDGVQWTVTVSDNGNTSTDSL